MPNMNNQDEDQDEENKKPNIMDQDPSYKPFDPLADTAEQEARKKAFQSIRNKFGNK